MIAALWLIQRFYLRTSRQLRLLDLEAKAPLYSHFLETFTGIVTIRAYGWQEKSRGINLTLVNASQKPFYLLAMVQRWLSLVLDLVTASIALIVVGLAVGLRDSVSAGSVGVSLVNLISFTSYIRMIVVLWASTETSLGAITRIKNFTEDTEVEDLTIENGVLLEDWPREGGIHFKSVSASYGLVFTPTMLLPCQSDTRDIAPVFQTFSHKLHCPSKQVKKLASVDAVEGKCSSVNSFSNQANEAE